MSVCAQMCILLEFHSCMGVNEIPVFDVAQLQLQHLNISIKIYCNKVGMMAADPGREAK